MIKSSEIKAAARRVGFDLCGVTRAKALTGEEARFSEWLQSGRGGSLDYLERNVGKRFDASLLVEGAESVAVCALNYKNELSCGYPEGDDVPKVASYAVYDDYHNTVRCMLRDMASRLGLEEQNVAWRVFSDSAPVAEKSLAVKAGLGAIGRNSLLITPQFGSFVLLGELIFTGRVDVYDEPFEKDLCGSCRLCIDRCPANAICGDRLIDASHCISRLTIEPYKNCVGKDACCGTAWRVDNAALNGWVFGCDDCQQRCPYNRRTPLFGNNVTDSCPTEAHESECGETKVSSERLRRRFNPLDMDVDRWLSVDEQEFESLFGSTPMSRCGLTRLKANIHRK